MSRRRITAVILLCIMLFTTGQIAMAQTDGEIHGAPGNNNSGGTSVYAGVTVDYMGRVRFLVLEKKSGAPIPGVSLEIWIPSQNRYVLCGVTDEDGGVEFDVVYESGRDAEIGIKVPDNIDSQTQPAQPTNLSSQAQPFTLRSKAASFSIFGKLLPTINNEDVVRGSVLYLPENTISYRCYKWGYYPYPVKGTFTLGRLPGGSTALGQSAKKVNGVLTLEIDLQLERREINGGGSGGTGINNITGSVVQKDSLGNTLSDLPELFPVDDSGGLESGVIPKTGVEGTMHYWLAALICFLIAGMILFFILRSDRDSNKKSGNDREIYHGREEK